MEKIESKRIMLYSVLIMGIVLVVVGVSYAYFTAMANSNEQIVNSGTLEIAYQNTKNISASSLMPTTEEHANIHQFTVTNTGTLDTTYNISMINIELLKNSVSTTSSNLMWALYEADSSYVEGSLVRKGSFSSESGYQQGDSEYVIVTDLPLAVDESQSYILKVWLQEAGTNQNEDQNMSLNFNIEVDTVDRNATTGIKSIMRRRDGSSSTENFYAYSDSIDKIIIQNQLNPISEATDNWDISASSDGSVMAYLTENPSGDTYTLYIQGNDRIYLPEKAQSLFRNFPILTTIEGLNYVDTSMSNTFYALFKDCSLLTNLDLSSFDTSHVTSMESMFADCASMTSIDLKNFNTNSLENMIAMFSGCTNLQSVDLSKFNTSNVTEMTYLFDQCETITSIDISTFDVSKVTNMRQMFSDCKNLVDLKLGNFVTSSVTDMSSMFYHCEKITSLDLSSFDTSSATTMHQMFTGCYLLQELIMDFDTSKVTNTEKMFSDCYVLEVVDLSHADFSNVDSYSGMFHDIFPTTQIIVKDAAAKEFVENAIEEIGSITITVAE